MSGTTRENSGHAPELPYQITYQQPHQAPFVVVECRTFQEGTAQLADRAMWLASAVGGTWHRVGVGLGPSEFLVLSPAGQTVLGTFALRRRIPAFRRQLPVDTKTTIRGRSV
jgi:hypothetical protein